jgi:hypothetical protein
VYPTKTNNKSSAIKRRVFCSGYGPHQRQFGYKASGENPGLEREIAATVWDPAGVTLKGENHSRVC